MSILDAAPAHSIWRITGKYPDGSGTFADCLATVLPQYTHGTDETLLAMLPPLGGPTGLVTPASITSSRLVIEDPWEEARLFTASEVVQIANETSDNQGNLYRLDFIDRIEHESALTKENN